MQHIEPSESMSFTVPVVGNSNTGKSQLLSRWTRNTFSNHYHGTIGVDFATKTLRSDKNDIKLNFWDLAGDTRYITDYTKLKSALSDSLVIIIVVNASDKKESKISQVKFWIEFFKTKINDGPLSFILVENKIDIENCDELLLTTADLAPFKDQYLFQHAISAKEGTNFNSFEIKFVELLPQLSQKHKFVSLTSEQAKLALQSLKNIISINSHICDPLQAREWLADIASTLDAYKNEPRELLYNLYLKIRRAASNVLFSRASTTQHLYEHTLPRFIERIIRPENLSLRLKINDFSILTNTDNIISDLINFLESGANKNSKEPYNLSFFSGKKHKVFGSSKIIIVPEHVYDLLIYLKQIRMNNTTNDLVNVFDKILIMMDSMNSNRKPSTKEFYETILPNRFRQLVESKQTRGHEVGSFHINSPC